MVRVTAAGATARVTGAALRAGWTVTAAFGSAAGAARLLRRLHRRRRGGGCFNLGRCRWHGGQPFGGRGCAFGFDPHTAGDDLLIRGSGGGQRGTVRDGGFGGGRRRGDGHFGRDRCRRRKLGWRAGDGGCGCRGLFVLVVVGLIRQHGRRFGGRGDRGFRLLRLNDRCGSGLRDGIVRLERGIVGRRAGQWNGRRRELPVH